MHGGGAGGGDGDFRRGVGGNGGFQCEIFPITMPIADDAATDGFVAGLDPCDIAHRLRCNADFLKSVVGGLDAREVVVKPFLNLAEHEMILRGTAIPRFGKAGLALGELHAVAGFVGLVVDVEDDVVAPAVGERAQHIPITHVASGVGGVVGTDVAHEGVEHGGAIPIVAKTKS